MEKKPKEKSLSFQREYKITDTGNIVDFIVDNKIVLELKAKKFVTKDDYYQVQRYLQYLDLPLALLINFRNQYLKPIRIVKINTDMKSKYID